MVEPQLYHYPNENGTLSLLTETEIFNIIKTDVNYDQLLTNLKYLTSITDYLVKAVRVNTGLFKNLPSNEQTIELKLNMLDAYLFLMVDVCKCTKDKINNKIYLSNFRIIFKRLINKQKVVDVLSGEDNLTRILNHLPESSILKKLTPYINDSSEIFDKNSKQVFNKIEKETNQEIDKFLVLNSFLKLEF